MAISRKKPTQKRVTIKALADQANRNLKPEREMPEYEFSNGEKTKKAGLGVYGYTDAEVSNE